MNSTPIKEKEPFLDAANLTDKLPFMTTTLTGKNQITVPAAVALRYGLKPGSRIEWLEGSGPDEILCRILPDPAVVASQLRGAGRRHLKPGADPIGQLSAERATDDKNRRKAL